VKEKKTSFPNNEPTDVGLGIKPKSTHATMYIRVQSTAT